MNKCVSISAFLSLLCCVQYILPARKYTELYYDLRWVFFDVRDYTSSALEGRDEIAKKLANLDLETDAHALFEAYQFLTKVIDNIPNEEHKKRLRETADYALFRASKYGVTKAKEELERIKLTNQACDLIAEGNDDAIEFTMTLTKNHLQVAKIIGISTVTALVTALAISYYNNKKQPERRVSIAKYAGAAWVLTALAATSWYCGRDITSCCFPQV